MLLEPTLTTLGNFLVRFLAVGLDQRRGGRLPAGGLRHDLSAFAWNIVRTYALTPGRRYSFGCRYRLGTASNLVMYVSAADNDYAGVTGTFLGTALGRLEHGAPGHAGRAYRERNVGCDQCNNVNCTDVFTTGVDASGAVSCAALAATGTVAGATLSSTGAVSGSSLSISGAASVGLLSSATRITGSTLPVRHFGWRHWEVHLGRAPGALVAHEAAAQGVVDVALDMYTTKLEAVQRQAKRSSRPGVKL